ncbi:MAG: 50S ribosome-binding GTPase, partial [Alistipes sp.]|nr:50S ribosome-binding GTPase [Alistipes sp.]
RALGSDIAGTTRDVIEEQVNIDGVLFRFLDTAGIRTTDDRLEQMGIERTLKSIARARIIIYMVDAATIQNGIPAPGFPLREDQTLLTVVNKIDMFAPATLPVGTIGISARSGAGVDSLCQALRSAVNTEGLFLGDAIVSSSRHFQALSDAHHAIGRARSSFRQGMPADLLAEEIRDVGRALSSITGRGAIIPDEILQHIFSKFCIGK